MKLFRVTMIEGRIKDSKQIRDLLLGAYIDAVKIGELAEHYDVLIYTPKEGDDPVVWIDSKGCRFKQM